VLRDGEKPDGSFRRIHQCRRFCGGAEGRRSVLRLDTIADPIHDCDKRSAELEVWMLPSPEPACLVIADISGYTDYLAGVELDHAQDILADLIDRVVKALRPRFKLAKLEGDAAFAYALTDKVDGSLLQDTIESAYFAFRRRVRDIRQASSCECDACRRIPTLDLKFVVHHGLVARQRMAGRDELVGRDVILIHRLLKNSASAKVGGHAYALYTDQCIKAMGVDAVAQGFAAHTEKVDVIGEVTVWVKDLEAKWRRTEEAKRVLVKPEEATGVIAYEVSAPPALIWELMTYPGRRKIWTHADDILESSPKGRRGSGTVNHCMHGKDAIVEEVLDWRPHDYLTSRFQMPMPGAPKFLMSDVLTPLPDGRTRVEIRIAPDEPKQKAAFDQIYPMMEPTLKENGQELLRLIEEEVSKHAGSDEPAEPALPVSAGRFASAPVVAGA
jgi:uncharacterized protein YndB with AHSA1/START domain